MADSITLTGNASLFDVGGVYAMDTGDGREWFRVLAKSGNILTVEPASEPILLSEPRRTLVRVAWDVSGEAWYRLSWVWPRTTRRWLRHAWANVTWTLHRFDQRRRGLTREQAMAEDVRRFAEKLRNAFGQQD